MHPAVLSVIEMAIMIAAFAGLYTWVLKPHLTRNAELESKVREQALEAKHTLAIQQLTEDAVRAEAQIAMRESKLIGLEKSLLEQEAATVQRSQSVKQMESEWQAKLESVAQITREQAQESLLAEAKTSYLPEFERWRRKLHEEAELSAQLVAKQKLVAAMERVAASVTTESTSLRVTLPSDDWKGRLIGREGRNIRAFEQTTGVELVIDEDDPAVVLSSFDPLRRETARLVLQRLIQDGRVQPARIEELYAEAQEELLARLLEKGRDAAERGRVEGLNANILAKLGALSLRQSYAQNVLEHSVETALLAGHLAEEIGVDPKVARRAALLHDIGKALGEEFEGPHALAGMQFLLREGEMEPVLNAVGAHHHDIEPIQLESTLVIIADTLSAARPGARSETLEAYFHRLEALETLAQSYPGVERSYAIQAGREVRVFVRPDSVNDVEAKALASQIAEAIERDQTYSGSIKVTVIREMRASAQTNPPSHGGTRE